MADINSDDIFQADLSKPLKDLNKDLEKSLETMKQVTIEANKFIKALSNSGLKQSATNTKKLTDEQKKLAAAQKETQRAAASLEKQRQRGLAQMAKQEAAEKELIRASKMEARTYEEMSRKLGALNKLRKRVDITTEQGRKKYQQLTQQVNQLNNSLKRMDKQAGVHSRNVGQYFQKAYVTAAAAMMLVVGALRRLSSGLTGSIDLYNAEIAAQKKLEVALGRTSDKLLKQASALQQVTRYGNETILEGQSYLAQMGLQEEQIERLTPLILDMATAQGISAGDAFKLVAKSVGSSTNAMSRYGIEIEGAVGSSERLESAVSALSSKFLGQSEAAARIGTGVLQQLKNAYGDLREQIGLLILRAINPLAEKLKNNIEYREKLIAIRNDQTGIRDEMKRVAELTTLLENENVPRGKKIKYVNELKSISPKYFGDLDTEAKKYDNLKDRLLGYNRAAVQRLILLSMSEDLVKAQSKVAKDETAMLKLQQNTREELINQIESLNKLKSKAEQQGEQAIVDLLDERIKKTTEILTKNYDVLETDKAISDMLGESRKTLNLIDGDIKTWGTSTKELQGINGEIRSSFFEIKKQSQTIDDFYANMAYNYRESSAELEKQQSLFDIIKNSMSEILDIQDEDPEDPKPIIDPDETDDLAEAMNKLNEEYKLQLKYAESLPGEQERAVAVLEATKNRLEGVQKLYQDIYFEDKFYSEDELQRLNDFNKEITLITEEIEKLKKAASEDNPFENWKPLDEAAGDVQGGEDEGKKSIWDILNDDDARDKLFRDIEAWANYATEVIGHVNQIISAGIERRINEETEAHEQDLEKFDAREKRIADAYGTESSQYQALLMQKERAEQVYNKKIADLKLKQAKLERNMRVFEITIQTALNVAKSYPNPYAMIAAGALGTVQTAAVLAQPLPQYYTGLESADKDHIGVIADRGQELVQYPDGTTELYKKKQPIFIPKNTKIYDNSDTEKILNSLILSSLTPAKSENNQYDFDKLDRRLSDINRTIKRKPVANMKQGYSWSDINYIKKMDV